MGVNRTIIVDGVKHRVYLSNNPEAIAAAEARFNKKHGTDISFKTMKKREVKERASTPPKTAAQKGIKRAGTTMQEFEEAGGRVGAAQKQKLIAAKHTKVSQIDQQTVVLADKPVKDTKIIPATKTNIVSAGIAAATLGIAKGEGEIIQQQKQAPKPTTFSDIMGGSPASKTIYPQSKGMAEKVTVIQRKEKGTGIKILEGAAGFSEELVISPLKGAVKLHPVYQSAAHTEKMLVDKGMKQEQKLQPLNPISVWKDKESRAAMITSASFGAGGLLGRAGARVAAYGVKVAKTKPITGTIIKTAPTGVGIGLGLTFVGAKGYETYKAPTPKEKGAVLGGATREAIAFGAGASVGFGGAKLGKGFTAKDGAIPKPTSKPKIPKQKDIPKTFEKGRYIDPHKGIGKYKGKIVSTDTITGKRVILTKEQWLKTSDKSYKPAGISLFGSKRASYDITLGRGRGVTTKDMTSKIPRKPIAGDIIPRSTAYKQPSVWRPQKQPSSIWKGKELVPTKPTPTESFKPKLDKGLVSKPTTPIKPFKPKKDIIPRRPQPLDKYTTKQPPGAIEPYRPPPPPIKPPGAIEPYRPPPPPAKKPSLEIIDPTGRKPPPPPKPKKPKLPKPRKPGKFSGGLPGIFIPPSPPGGGGYMQGWGRTKRGSRTKTQYTPSLIARTFGIYGKKPTGQLSGLEFRPMVGKPRKAKKKKKGRLGMFEHLGL